MNYEAKTKAISEVAKRYKETKNNEDFAKLTTLLNGYINNTIMRIFNKLDEDVKSKVIIKLLDWLNVEKEDMGKYLITKIIYFVRRERFENSNMGLTKNEKYEFIKTYKDSSPESIKRYNELKSKIIHLDLGIDYETVNSNACLFESVKDLLTEDEYKIVYSYFKENYTLEEIGVMLNISKQAVDKRLKNILKKLKDELVIE